MTPKEMALNLFQKYDTLCRDYTKGVSIKDFAKDSALIAVDEIMIALTALPYDKNYLYERDYWAEVVEEIEKL